MKKMSSTVVLLAVLGLLVPGASVFGQWIANISEAEATGNAYLVGGLSADGRYVGISRYIEWGANQTPYDGPALYDTTTHTYLPHGLKSGHGAVRGVDALADGTPVSLVVEVSNVGTASWRVGTYPGDTNSYMDGAGSIPGNSNAMAMGTDGNGWMVGGAYATNHARAWKITNGVVNSTAAYSAVHYGGKEVFNGVSRSGLAVGNWSDGQDRSMIRYVDGIGSGRALNFGQISSSNRSQGNAMSSNGQWAGGFVYVDDANTLNGWRLGISPTFPAPDPDPTLSDGTYTRLFPVDFDPGRVQQSNVFDIAEDGTAVGFSYDPDTSYHATLWAAGSDQGVRVWDILAGLGVDLSEWERLERAVSISDDGQTIAGRGILADGVTYSAFVAVIPEPSTISLLVLGGLFLLRRRR